MEPMSAEQAFDRGVAALKEVLKQAQGPHRDAALQVVTAFVHYIGAAATGAGPTAISSRSGSTTGNFNSPNCGRLVLAEYK
jgi:hypothetical protein